MLATLSPAAIRLVREVRLRRQLGIAGQRRRVPRQQPPDAIARDYARELLVYVREARAALEPLFAELPAMLERAARERARGDARLDAGEGKRVRELIEQAQTTLAAGMAQPQLEQQAERFAHETQTYQRRQFLGQTRAALGIDVTLNDPRLGALIDGFASENVALIKDIPARIMRDVELATTRALASGTLWPDLAKELEAKFGFSEARAKLIARDQIGKLYGQVTAERHQEIGVKRFTWRSVHDGRVRPEHADLDGKTFSYAQPPSVGIPGEPINCRCYADPVLDDILDALDDDEDTASPFPAQGQAPSTLPGYSERVTPIIQRRGNQRRGPIPTPPAAPAPAAPPPAPAAPAPAPAPTTKKPRQRKAPAVPKPPKAPTKPKKPKLTAAEKSRDKALKQVAAGKLKQARDAVEANLEADGYVPTQMVMQRLISQHNASSGSKLPMPRRPMVAVHNLPGAYGEHALNDGTIKIRSDQAINAARFAAEWEADPVKVRAELARANELRGVSTPQAFATLPAPDQDALRTAQRARGLHTIVHEVMHGYGPVDIMSKNTTYTGVGLLVEEVATDMAARAWMRSRIGIPLEMYDRGAGLASVGGYPGWCARMIDTVQDLGKLSRQDAIETLERAAIAYKKLPAATVNTQDEAVAQLAKLLPGDQAEYRKRMAKIHLTDTHDEAKL